MCVRSSGCFSERGIVEILEMPWDHPHPPVTGEMLITPACGVGVCERKHTCMPTLEPRGRL